MVFFIFQALRSRQENSRRSLPISSVGCGRIIRDQGRRTGNHDTENLLSA